MNEKTGIILEGGAMRSIYTAGIMDFYLDKNIHIPNMLAVSAGAYAGMNYVSNQRGRILDAVVKPMETERVLGFRVLMKTGDFFNMDLLFNRIPREDCPFDFEAFQKSGKRFITSTTNCLTGECVYYDKFKDLDEFLKIIRVANSLPLLSRVGYIDDTPMMDGGMADAIPIQKALDEGWDKIIVVLSRDINYRKIPGGDSYDNFLTKLVYHKYKELLKTIKARPDYYNHSLDVVYELEQQGKAFVYRPEGITLTNKESNPDVLRHYYQVGYEHAEARYDELMEFLNK